MPRIRCRVCRRVGDNVCGREKCAFKKRPFPPGKLDSEKKHKSNRSEYGEQLRSKQKLKMAYGLRETQFANYVRKAINTKGVNTQELINRLLESRLDNVVFRMGLANTRALARQIVNHGHITVNGRKLSIPSYQIKKGDKVSVREGSRGLKYFAKLAEKYEPTTVTWLKIDPKTLTAVIEAQPKELDKSFDYQSVVEFYSR